MTQRDHTLAAMKSDPSADLKTNPISAYWDWLNTLDPRLRQILVDLDDEHCSGRVGSRQNFDGDLVYRIYSVATGPEDFIDLYTTSFNGSNGGFGSSKIDEARRWWNVITRVKNDTMRELADIALKASLEA